MMSIVSVQGVPYLACLVMILILSYVGVHVLKREIIFIDIALAQIAAVGAIAAHVVLSIDDHSFAAHLVALGTTFASAAAFAILRRRVRQIPLEAIIGVSYAIAAAAALFLVGIAPGGHVHIQSMLSGSILWATWREVLTSAAIFAAVGGCFVVFRKQFQTISDDYDGAAARGVHTTAWDFFFYALVSIVITTAVHIGGVVVVFSFLIMPVTAASMLVRGWIPRLMVSWLIGAIAAAAGLLFAGRFDFSVGPAIALWLGVALVLIAMLRRAGLARRVTLAMTTAILVVMALGFGVGNPSLSRTRAVGVDDPVSIGTEEHGSSHHHGYGIAPAETEDKNLDETQLATIGDPKRLEELYDDSSDVYEQSLIVCRLIELDRSTAFDLAIRYLSQDPPLLFRQSVVEKLDAIAGRSGTYDVQQPFAAPGNQDAVRRFEEAMKTP